ncbi:MAG: cytidine deaminase [Gaiellales bacterium]|nr:cytidine deaminase [Gaiellales bacterium]
MRPRRLWAVRRPATSAEIALYEAAREAREHAYAPYSEFPVGAALRLEDGTVVAGANIENASFGLTVCAERSAVFTAAFSGARSFSAIAVAGHDGLSTLLPCGGCRQVLAEFAPSIPVVHLYDGEVVVETLDVLLPDAASSALPA